MVYYMLGLFTIFIPFMILSILLYWIKIREYQKSEYFRITHIPYIKMRCNSGHLGEYCIYKYLSRLPGKKRFLFNCYIPADNDNTTEIDVLMLHGSGIYVFESKNFSGWIFGSENQKYWTQSLAVGKGHGKTQKVSFFNPIWQNKKHLKWLQEYLKDYPSLPYYSYIVFSERCTLKKLILKTQEHIVVKRNDILSSVSARAKANLVLSSELIDKIYQTLYPRSQVDTAVRLKHLQYVQSIQKDNVNTLEKKCPYCGQKLVLRTAAKGSNTGKKFYGCSNFPQCRYIENITDFT